MALRTICCQRSVRGFLVQKNSDLFMVSLSRLLGRFYDWHRTQSDEIVQLEDDPRRSAIHVQLPLQETLFSCIFFSLTTLPFLINQQGRSLYWKICLIGTPLSLLWLHLCPPSRTRI